MSWKNWPNWARGGLIGLIIYVLLAISNISPITTILAEVQQSVASMFLSSTPTFAEMLRFAYLFSFVIAPLIWFGVGALIGWIIGKVKSRTKKR